MKISKITATIALLCLGAAAAGAQEYEKFMEAAKEQSVLYRGRQATQYTTTCNGTYFWSSKSFQEGSVLYNHKLYTGVLLNIDALSQRLLVRLSNDQSAVSLSTDEVEWCKIGSRVFVNLRQKGVGGAEQGFYEVLSEEAQVYLRVDKSIHNAVDSKNGEGIGYHDPDYRNDVLSYYAYVPRYYMMKDGKLTKVSKKKALKNAGKN